VVSDQLQASATLSMDNSLGALRVGMDAEEKIRTSCTCQESTTDYSVSDPQFDHLIGEGVAAPL
jgi:hypothetical protein